MAVPGVIRELIEAAQRRDLAAMHALIDWELAGAAAMSRALGGVEIEKRVELSRRGAEEIADSSRSMARVESILRELALDLNAPALAARRAEGAEAEGAIAAVQVAPTPEGIDGEARAVLDAARPRAEALSEVWMVGSPKPGRVYRMVIAPEGRRVILAPQSARSSSTADKAR